ncbi:CRISPR-associated protein, Csm2 family [Eubacterium ruminantium]|nr:CRISPR-associated protein, Csm2 family [Eubacterium ruminantium]
MTIINETNYVDVAEKTINRLKEKKDNKGKPVGLVTTSKIRNILAMGAEIYNDVLLAKDETLDNELKGRIDYLRIRTLYEAGRDSAVKSFVIEARVPDIIKEIKTKQDYILFYRYMESLVAFHRFFGGKDM